MRRRKNSKLLIGLLIAIITLGVGYAAITGVNLLVNGSATLKSSDANFNVRFVKPLASEEAITNPEQDAITISGKNADDSAMDVSSLTATIVDDTHATFDAGELNEVGEYVEFTYKVVNESDGVDAMLSFDIADVNDATDYFELTKTVNKSIIEVGEVAEVRVKVKLINRPVVSDFNATFTVTLNASPVEEEDISSNITGSRVGVGNAAQFAKATQNNNVDTIELTNDIAITKKTALTIDDDTTIEFNGYTLTVEPGSIKVSDGAVLTLTDDSQTGGIESANNAVTVETGSEVVVESGTYKTTDFTDRGSVITIPKNAENAKITINGGTINGEYFAVTSFGDGEVEINGGNIVSTATVKKTDNNGNQYYAYAVRLSEGHLVMNGGTVNGIHGGIGIIGTATATINSGTVILNNSYVGAKDSYYCLYADGNASAEVINPTFTNNGTNPIVYSSSTGYINLRGGNYTGTNAKALNGSPNAGKNSIKVYGGTYKKNASGTLTDYDVSAYFAE